MRVSARVSRAASNVSKSASKRKPKILSPYKLAKHDIQNQRRAVTKGPKGHPGKGCSGSICYNHPTVDWTVHRLAPAIHADAKKGGKVRGVMETAMQHPNRKSKIGKKIVDKYPALEGMSKRNTRHMGKFLRDTSPRWGEGHAAGLRGRKTVPLPKDRYVSGKTMAVVGGAAAAAGGYEAYKHRKEIKEKVGQFAHARPHFHRSIGHHVH